MYEILENKQRMTRDEIRQKFDGKWIFLVDLEGELYSPFASAIPVVVADSPWDGYETGIYHEFRDNLDYNSYMHFSLLKDEWNVFGFSEVEYVK
ncbi:MAG: hypothetical protein FWB74_07945 [Defluviitaleaceae bacterium]|nr:hypothetical protein [Defluviitaleaceae bacterium]